LRAETLSKNYYKKEAKIWRSDTWRKKKKGEQYPHLTERKRERQNGRCFPVQEKAGKKGGETQPRGKHASKKEERFSFPLEKKKKGGAQKEATLAIVPGKTVDIE